MEHPRASDTSSSTQALIQQTFLDLYAKKPLSRIFVSDLAQACHISRGTFYFHYENVEQLYHHCEQDLISFMEQDLASVILCTVGGSRDNMSAYIETYARRLSQYPKRQPQFQCLLTGSERASFRLCWVGSIRRHFMQTLSFSRTLSPSRQEYLLEFFSGGTMQMLSSWILNGCKASPEEIAAIHAQMLFEGAFVTNFHTPNGH